MSDLLAPSRARHAELAATLADLPDGEGTPARIRLQLSLGRHDDAWAAAAALAGGDLEERLLAARVYLTVSDFPRLTTLVQELTPHVATAPVRRLLYRFWLVIDDLARIDRTLSTYSDDPADRLVAGRLAIELRDFESASDHYRSLLDGAPAGDPTTDPPVRARALAGLAAIDHRQRRYDDALARQREALELAPLEPDLLLAASHTLIRLGRTEEAIDLAEHAVTLAPWHESAHYLLGNGYARRDYSQLLEAHPDAFAGTSGQGELRRGDEHAERGELEAARRIFAELGRERPGRADVAVRLGSIDFARGAFRDARTAFRRALELCPDYGRAHNGLAKAIEGERLAVEVHRERWARRFAGLPQPPVPEIERFVVNWTSLAPRHRKQVALSVSPWRRWVSVLLEAGATFYVKPLHQLLSESPDLEPLRDRRIAYDARLWDDVRGCGGFHTVTGVEDVERTIWGRYNTVLHELTHQVHEILPARVKRRLQELFRQAKRRDQATGDAFVSRYAGENVWEYFAEGANALATPRRDLFDRREVVRERLEERDPELRRTVRELQGGAELEASRAVALAVKADDRLRRGEVEEALAVYGEARQRAPGEEEITAGLIFALLAAGRPDEALGVATAAAAAEPASAELARRLADARWLAGRPLETVVAGLATARQQVRSEEQFRVELHLGWLAWTAGDAAAAGTAYDAVLAYQSDHPEGLWGKAAAVALAGEHPLAWELYDQAVERQSGRVDLRIGFARDLLLAGELERARSQIDAALLLDAGDPEAMALDAWWQLEDGELEAATELSGSAVEGAPWSDLARLVAAAVAERAGRAVEAQKLLAPWTARLRAASPPEYVHVARTARWVLTHTLPAVLRDAGPWRSAGS